MPGMWLLKGGSTILLAISLVGACGQTSTPEIESTVTLEELLGIALTEEQRAEEEVALSLEIEERIAECMSGIGFTYIPFTPSRPEVFEREGPADWGVVQPVLEGLRGEAAIPIERNPNDEHLDALSDEDRNRWLDALLGGMLAAPAEMSAEEVGEMIRADASAGRGGCQERARSEAIAASGRNVELISELERQIAEASVNDRRIQEAIQGWARCMAESGYSYPDESAVIADLNVLIGEAFREIGPQNQDELVQALEGLQAEERSLFAASTSCGEPVRDARAAVHSEVEERFLGNNS